MTDRFKGLDLVNRMPEEPCTEVHNIVQEAANKPIPKKKKCKKAKWLSEEALQVAEERREAKSKGERERCTQLNAEFQRIARETSKPSPMNNGRKQENIWRGRLEVSKKTGSIKGKCHPKMDTIKERNHIALIETEIKKRWQACKEMYKRF